MSYSSFPPRDTPVAPPQTLRVAASHDLALAQLRDALPAAGPLRLEVTFMGSLEALDAYARGRADVAGFHVAPELMGYAGAAEVRRMLRPSRDRLVRFAARDVALLAAAGLLAGFPLAVAAGRALESYLYGVKPWDATVLGIVGAAVLSAAVAAGYLPARRVSRIDPVAALRRE